MSCCVLAYTYGFEMQFQQVEGLSSHEYAVEVRLAPDESHPNQSLSTQQNARTRGNNSYGSISSDVISVKWNEAFFFKVDSPVCTLCLHKSLVGIVHHEIILL